MTTASFFVIEEDELVIDPDEDVYVEGIEPMYTTPEVLAIWTSLG
jgi:hypothetical protein